MIAVYVDTSVIVGLLFKQGSFKKQKAVLDSAHEVLSANLLESELLAVCKRENISFDRSDPYLDRISLILPERSLRPEYTKTLSSGYCRGADLYHLACALYLDPGAKELIFLTADEKQRVLAKELGFQVGG